MGPHKHPIGEEGAQNYNILKEMRTSRECSIPDLFLHGAIFDEKEAVIQLRALRSIGLLWSKSYLIKCRERHKVKRWVN